MNDSRDGVDWIEPAIEVRGLEKYYGDFRALSDVDLVVPRGEVFGFLGPNGAGKTTLIRCLLDLIRPSAGSIRVAGIDPQADPVSVRGKVGYLPGELNLDESLSGKGALELFDSLRGKVTDWKFVANIAERLSFDTAAKIRNLSKGNKQKVGVIQALMHRPELLLLDEPTSGLDPLIQKAVLSLVADAREAGATVFFSSHILSEVQEIADRVAVVRSGRIIETAATSELLKRSLRNVRISLRRPCPKGHLAGIESVTPQPDSSPTELRLQVAGDLGPVIAKVIEFEIQDVESTPASLEEIFLAYYRD